jgi:hypothetical protein
MNEKNKRLKLVKFNEDISTLKDDKDKVFYYKEEDIVEYFFGIPWIKLWYNSDFSIKMDVQVPINEFVLNQSLRDYLGNITLTKTLIWDDIPFVRISRFDKTESNTDYYAWLSTEDSEQTTLLFTTTDYDFGNYSDRTYNGQVAIDTFADPDGPPMIVGSNVNTNSDDTVKPFKVVDYFYEQETVSQEQCKGKRFKLNRNFEFNNIASGLTKVIMSDGIHKLNKETFRNCTSLTSIDLPPTSLTMIDNYAFQNCTGLTAIYIPSTVKRIESNVFNGCTNLTLIRYDGTAEPSSLSHPWGAPNAMWNKQA